MTSRNTTGQNLKGGSAGPFADQQRKRRAPKHGPHKTLLGAAKGRITFHGDLTTPTLPNFGGDPLYRAAPLGRSTDGRSAADHDWQLHAK